MCVNSQINLFVPLVVVNVSFFRVSESTRGLKKIHFTPFNKRIVAGVLVIIFVVLQSLSLLPAILMRPLLAQRRLLEMTFLHNL